MELGFYFVFFEDDNTIIISRKWLIIQVFDYHYNKYFKVYFLKKLQIDKQKEQRVETAYSHHTWNTF